MITTCISGERDPLITDAVRVRVERRRILKEAARDICEIPAEAWVSVALTAWKFLLGKPNVKQITFLGEKVVWVEPWHESLRIYLFIYLYSGIRAIITAETNHLYQKIQRKEEKACLKIQARQDSNGAEKRACRKDSRCHSLTRKGKTEFKKTLMAAVLVWCRNQLTGEWTVWHSIGFFAVYIGV